MDTKQTNGEKKLKRKRTQVLDNLHPPHYHTRSDQVTATLAELSLGLPSLSRKATKQAECVPLKIPSRKLERQVNVSTERQVNVSTACWD